MRTVALIASLSLAFLTACASTQTSSATSQQAGQQATQPEVPAEGITHQASEADRLATRSSERLTGSTAILFVNGLGCPLCATNIDRQLERLPGVNTVGVDLSSGKVTLGFLGRERPTAIQVSEAVEDAGFTLVKIQSN